VYDFIDNHVYGHMHYCVAPPDIDRFRSYKAPFNCRLFANCFSPPPVRRRDRCGVSRSLW